MRHLTFLIIILAIQLSVQAQKNNIPKIKEVKKITQKVADWQIETFDDMGKYRALPKEEDRKRWHHRERYHDLEWHCGALYAGMFEWAMVSGDEKYFDWLSIIGKKNKWRLFKRMYHADDHTVGQFYLNMARYYDKGHMMRHTQVRFDSIMASDKADKYHWHWCDALFMAPPVWARLANITGNQKYLNYMDSQYRKTYNRLWDKEEQLFFRDSGYFNKREDNGEKIFWARGNGWVFGGLALMLPEIPDDWEGKKFYTDMFIEMAETLKKIQRTDGTWSSGLLGGEEAYKNIETSGTSFYTFGLLWGINNGLLDKNTYEPVAIKAWHALVGAVTKEGMLGYVQPVGAAPGVSWGNYTELYGSGAFLAAGAEMCRYLDKHYPKPIQNKKAKYITFLKDGGWCWYQDPRVIIKNGKLIIAGLDGQNGNVRIGVYDLAKELVVGDVVLHKNLQIDDHDVPALYARPDGSILAVWAKHANEKIHYYCISSPENYLEWGDVQQHHHNYNHRAGVTYMNLYYLKDLDLLYNFYRDGETYNPAYINSDNHGETWGNRTHFISNDVLGRQRPYVRYYQRNENTIGISFTDAHPRNYGNSLYYVEFRNSAFYKVDGTKIKDISNAPLGTSMGEKIYKGSETKKKPFDCESVPNSAWNCAMASDADNNPYLGYTLYLNNDDHRYRVAAWDGSKWNDKEIAYAGGNLYYWESSYTGLFAFDPTNPKKVYISSDVNPSTGKDLGGKHEIYTGDISVENIKWKAITKKSGVRNIRPIVVSGEGYKVLVWLRGPWHTFINYDVDVVGEILERP